MNSRKPLNICLIAMPWNDFRYAQPALGVLKSFVQKNAPEYSIGCRYEYLKVWQQCSGFYETWSRESFCELLYLAQFYPGQKEIVKKTVIEQLNKEKNEADTLDCEKMFEHVVQITHDHIEELVKDLANRFSVIGLTTTYNQLFASLALGKKLKQVDPEVQLVLGGSGMPVQLDAFIREYAFIDYVIQGEGEVPFLTLLRGLEKGQTDFIPESGIWSQNNIAHWDPNTKQVDFCQLKDLKELPVPNYDEYFELVDSIPVVSTLMPVETSRGCWWNRMLEDNSSDQVCYFCGDNIRSLYRMKPNEQVVQELMELSQKYQRTRFQFMDNIFRTMGGMQLTRQIKSQGVHFRIHLETRVSARPIEFLELWEAGLEEIQLGIEGLSTSYLKRMNKGTTTIQNLQAMKICWELGVVVVGNLLMRFPGATQSEVDETLENIEKFAICYRPLHAGNFRLEPHSVVFTQPQRFGIGNIRNESRIQRCFPPSVAKKYTLRWEYDELNPAVDWSPVEQAANRWKDLHFRLFALDPQNPGWELKDPLFCKPLFYTEGNSFLEIVDQRDTPREIILTGFEKEVYSFCMQIRSRRAIFERFANRVGEEKLEKEILRAFVRERLMFAENHHYLSLAAASRPDLAAQRIRNDHRV